MGAHHLRHIASQIGYFAHQRAGDALQRRIRQQEHGFDRGQQLAVHRGHLRFVIKVGQVADAAHHRTGALLAAEIHDEAVKRQHAHLAWQLGGRLTGHREPVLQAKAGLFVVRHGHRDDHLVKQLRRAPRHVFVPAGDGVEGAAVNRDAGRGRVHGKDYA